jgi:hypothetical protein
MANEGKKAVRSEGAPNSQELLESNLWMRAVFQRLVDSSTDGIFAFDQDYRY